MESTFFDNLKGEWNFVRFISMQKNKINGHAMFVKKGVIRLDYHEEGTYIVNDVSYDFFQKRTFQFSEHTLIIYKMDGSILHVFNDIAPNKTYPINLTHTHQCGSDTYYCSICLINESTFEVNYSIIGGHKNYEIQTRYIKQK